MMNFLFRWNAWNVDHIAEHGILPEEAEYAVAHAVKPYPAKCGAGKYLVVGQTAAGEYLQVIYIFDPPGVTFVIHARPLNFQERIRFRRRSNL